jgi:hypothetical protein
MTIPSHRRTLRVSLIAILLGAILASFGRVLASPWANHIARSPRIILTYPELISPEAAEALLADRGEALAFAEATLGGQLYRRLLITIQPTLLVSWAYTEPADRSGAITFHIPVTALERFEMDRTSPFTFVGCHEEVHAVANYLWKGNEFGTRAALSEGVAVYVDELHCATRLRWAIAGALQEVGLIYPVDVLLGGCPLDENPGLYQLNTYYVAATLVEFLLECDGWDLFAELYSVEWFQWDAEQSEPMLEEADPAEEIERVYGASIGEIDRAWQERIAAQWSGTAKDAGIFVDAFASEVRVLDLAVTELERTWDTHPYVLLGPSADAEERYAAIARSVLDLAELRGGPLAEAHGELLEMVDRLQTMLTAWLDAIHAYEEALELQAGDGSTGQLTPLLETAIAGYRAAGDNFMVDKAAAWLERL